MTTLNNIKNLIDVFNNEDPNIIHTPKIKGESNYMLDQYNIRVNKLKYQEFISKNKKDMKKEREINIHASGDDFMNKFERNRYLKTWNKLDEYAKKIKLKEYFTKWLLEHTLSSYTLNDLINKYNQDVKQIKVDYDDKEGYIRKIEKWIIN